MLDFSSSYTEKVGFFKRPASQNLDGDVPDGERVRSLRTKGGFATGAVATRFFGSGKTAAIVAPYEECE